MFADEAEKSLDCWLKVLLMKVVGVFRRENMWKEVCRNQSFKWRGFQVNPSLSDDLKNLHSAFFR